MKQKVQKIQERINSDPKLKEAVEKIKPKKTVWGILGIVLFFFIPELVTYIWQEELVDWAHLHSITEASSSVRMIYRQLEKMFLSGVSWFNIILGLLLLFWVMRSSK